MTRMLCLDPGGTTGVAWFNMNADAPIELLEVDQVKGGSDGAIRYLLAHAASVDILVSESFVLDGRTPKPDVTPLRIEGAMEALHLSGLLPKPVMQRNNMKVHANDVLLKRAGLWKPGQQHARDAIRHGIAYAKSRGHRPTIEWLWPAPAGF